MRFKFSTKEQRKRRKVKKIVCSFIWHKKFVFWPRYIGNGHWAVFETVYRRRRYKGGLIVRRHKGASFFEAVMDKLTINDIEEEKNLYYPDMMGTWSFEDFEGLVNVMGNEGILRSDGTLWVHSKQYEWEYTTKEQYAIDQL